MRRAFQATDFSKKMMERQDAKLGRRENQISFLLSSSELGGSAFIYAFCRSLMEPLRKAS